MKTIEQLEIENAALAAQVEAFKKIREDWKGLAINDANDTKTLIAFIEAAGKAPQQHLAEIRAGAGRAGYLKGADDWKPFDQCFDSDIQNCANQYAEQVRRGEVE